VSLDLVKGDKVRYSWFDGGNCEKKYASGTFLYRVGKHCVIETDKKTIVEVFYLDVVKWPIAWFVKDQFQTATRFVVSVTMRSSKQIKQQRKNIA